MGPKYGKRHDTNQLEMLQHGTDTLITGDYTPREQGHLNAS